jgi:hypothetical protein
MDKVDRRLSAASVNPAYSPAIRKACALAKELLNKYYSLTDASNMYRIAMGELQLLFSLDFYSPHRFSPPSTTQAALLREGRVGGGLDNGCAQNRHN